MPTPDFDPEADAPPRTPVLCAALAVALNARSGQSSLHDVDHMRMLAEELLPQRDGLREAILSFATRWEGLKRDSYALRLLGEELDRALQAEELLPQRDGLREAILSFATRWEGLKRDSYALRLLGEELDRALQAALHPAAPPPRPHWADRDE